MNELLPGNTTLSVVLPAGPVLAVAPGPRVPCSVTCSGAQACFGRGPPTVGSGAGSTR